jgi:hypothetical protein
MVSKVQSNPLDIVAASSKRITPTLIQYEVGSEVEIIIFNLLSELKKSYEKIIIVSFYDAYATLLRYLNSVFNPQNVQEVFDDVYLVSISPLLEVNLKPNDVIKADQHEIISGRLFEITGLIEEKSLILILGPDFFGIKIGKDSLIELVPSLMTTLSRKKDLNIIITLNIKIFPENIIEIINSFAFNVIKLGVEVSNSKIKRQMTILRSVFLEYNLKRWYYKLLGKTLIFTPAFSED